MHGDAKCEFNDGSTYEGEYVEGEREGFGIYISSSERYEGFYLKNMRHGIGMLISTENGSEVTQYAYFKWDKVFQKSNRKKYERKLKELSFI